MNSRSLIQQSETLPIELTGTHYCLAQFNTLKPNFIYVCVFSKAYITIIEVNKKSKEFNYITNKYSIYLHKSFDLANTYAYHS